MASSRITRLGWFGPIVALLLVAIAGGSARTAAAQDAAPRLVLRGVDATEATSTRLTVTWSGDQDDLADLAVQDGAETPPVEIQSLAEAGEERDVVFVVDTSASSDANALLSQSRRALSEFLAEPSEGVRYGIVAVGARAATVSPLGDQPADVERALDALSPEGEGGLLGGVTRAAALNRGANALVDVVLLTDGVRESTVRATAARASLAETGAVLHVVGLTGGNLDTGAFADLAAGSGGTSAFTDDPAQLGALVDDLRPALSNGAVATFAAPVAEGVHDLVVTVDGANAQGSYVQGRSLVGPSRLAPRAVSDSGGVTWLRSGLAKYLGMLLAVAAIAGFVWALLALLVPDDDGLSAALRPYADSYVAEQEDAGTEGAGALAQTAFLQRAVALTESFAERQGLLARVERALEKAGLPLRAGEAIFFYLAGVVVVLLLAAVLTQNAIATLIIGLLALLLPPAVVNFMATRKKKAFEALLPDTLQLLSSTLRAGYSMMQGVEAVSQEAAEPMGGELRRVVTEARLGRPLEESLESVAARMESKDFEWAVMAIRIQREVGGNLSELLLTVGETMTQRERLRRDISALTAEGRISAYVLLGLPIGLGLFLYTVNRDYIGKLFEETLGQVMLGAAVVMILIGMTWMMKIIKIEV